MKPLLSEKTRRWLGRKYVDWSALLPTFGGTFIRTLQDTKQHHKEIAEEAYQRSRPPENVELGLPYFQLIEMFNLEDFDDLCEGVFRLLPDLKDEFLHKSSTAAFATQAESIQGSGSGHLGYLVRDISNHWLGMGAYRELPKLPDEVTFIKIEYNKVLPSVFLITFDVHLTEAATRKLISLQDRPYEPAVLFRSVLPWRSDHGWSETPPENEMARAILVWLEELRSQVEECIRPFLRGYFTRRSTRARARLPAIEVYTLKHAPEELSAFVEWTTKVTWWLESFGFRFIFDVYTDERLIFVFPQGDESTGRPSYRLIALWNSYLQSISTLGHGGDERRAISYNTTYILRAFVTLIALHEFLNTVQGNVARLRRLAFDAMKRNRFLGRYMKLNSTILWESIVLDRIAMEFHQQKDLIRHHAREVGEFKEFPQHGSQNSEENNLASIMLTGLENRMQRLKEQMEHVKHSFSDFLAVQNMKAAYRLQAYVLVLSIVATLAAIVSAVAVWPSIKEFLKANSLTQ